MNGVLQCINAVCICYNLVMKKHVIFEKKEGKNKIQVADTFLDGEPVRICFCNGYMQSGIYLDEERKSELLFPYMRYFSYAFTIKEDIQSVLLIGGGTFSYPLYFLDHYRRMKLTAVEMNQDMIALAYTYFGLDDLDIEEKSNLTIIHEDAFQWLQTTEQKFDWIINDAFCGNEMMGRNASSLDLVFSHLKSDGIYMENLVSALKGPFKKPLVQEEELLNRYFTDITKMRSDDTMSLLAKQNILLTCSGKKDI